MMILALDSFKRAVVTTLARGVAWAHKFREDTVLWDRRARGLDGREAELRARMHPEMAPSLHGARLLVFGEMLASVGFPNADAVIENMAGGFRVVGRADSTGVFEEKDAPPPFDPADLLRTAKVAQDVLIASLGPSGDDDLDDQLRQITPKELDDGWLRGPMTRAELDAKCGDWVPVKRFDQARSSVRAIADYSLLAQNGARSVTERVDLIGVDLVVGAARAFMAVPPDNRLTASLKLESGEL